MTLWPWSEIRRLRSDNKKLGDALIATNEEMTWLRRQLAKRNVPTQAISRNAKALEASTRRELEAAVAK